MAAAASSSYASTSSSSSSQKKYDVFLSFRGEDTRDNFLSHLHKSLSDAKILTFIDNKLERGQEISQSLLDAIEASRISLVIFSENYATSKWCLDELVKILECKDRHGQIVIPVFYRVDPSDVRKQTGSYAMAFARHEQQIKLVDMVKTWRDALEKAANLAGWDSRGERSDAELIEEIVEIVSDALKKLNPIPSNHSHNLVGIDSKIEKILSLLHLESLDVRILGIWGAGGIGKTTMAIQIFECICNKFEEHYLLQDAKEALKQHVLIPWGHRRLPIILKERSSHKSTSCLDPAYLGERTHLKRVLAILDDVDDSMTLQDLLREREASFGPGSRIILTSRDKHVLKVVADEIYEVKKLNDDDALKLFNLHAFKTHRPSEFVHLSKRVAKYAEGNPLALKVLGSALFGKCKDDWESALKDLSQVSSREILDVLRVSYDGLNYVEKKIFLYVAIFFRRENVQLVMQILSSCFGEVQFMMGRLVEKALLAVNYNKLEMHNLLRELGKKVITEESRNEIGLLCDPHQIKHMLMRKKGTEAIEGISLDLTKIEELVLDSDAFMGMDRLKVLQFYSSGRKSEVHLPRRGLEFISDELRYLEWDGYPSKCLPVKFCAENLVSLQLRESNVKQLWAGVQNVVNLKQIDLTDSTCLITLPDLSKALNVEKITLQGCESLEELPLSIQYLTKLEDLDLSVCNSLRRLPSRLDSPVLSWLNLRFSGKVKRCPKTSSGNLKYFCFEGAGIEEPPQSSLNELERLLLYRCSNITKFPEVSENIRELELVGTGITEIPSSIEFCTRLTKLSMKDSKELLSISTGVCKLKSLEVLSLWGCSKLESFPEIQEPMQNLRTLDLSFCKNLIRLPNCFHNLKSLRYLGLRGTAIEELPSSIGLLTRLEYLIIDGCKIGVEEWQQLRCLQSLRDLRLTSCNLTEIPISFCSLMQQLFWLDLSENNFEMLPPDLHQLSVLKDLKLNKCRRLRSLPELPGSLLHLEANDCESLETISPGGRKQLMGLLLGNCRKLDQGTRDELVAETLTRYNIQEWDEYGPYFTLLPGNEIPEWFGGYRGKGSSITITLPSTINHHQSYTIAFCFVFASSSASAVLPSLKSKFVAPTPAEHLPTSYCELTEKGKTDEMPRLHLEIVRFGPLLVESDHVLMLRREICFSSRYAGKDVSVEWTLYGDDVKPLKHFKVKKWRVQIHPCL